MPRGVTTAREKRKYGIVLEIQMGMVDRGADISWLSQCIAAATRNPRRSARLPLTRVGLPAAADPFEQEILFAPLTALEVRAARPRPWPSAHPAGGRARRCSSGAWRTT